MCGRYTSTTSTTDLAAHFGVDEVVAPELGPRYNVAPTDETYVVATAGAQRRLGLCRWGLVPPWADDPSVGSRMINARAETLLEKRAFARAFARRRCLIPIDGFYEWQPGGGAADPGGRTSKRPKKQPWYLRGADGSPLAVAGLWESWRPRGAGPAGRLVTCTIITTVANDTVRPLHDRMPVLLPPSAWSTWLDADDGDAASLRDLLAPAPAAALEVVRVTTAVNDVRNDGPHLIEPVAPQSREAHLP